VSTIDLGYRPREWQRQCHLSRKRFTVLALHRRAGKTELALAELIDKALRCALELPMFVYVAPYLKQAKAIAWARLKRRVAPLVAAGMCEVNESELWVRLVHNQAMLRVFGADNPDAMRGMRFDGVVIDEVADVKAETWQDVIQPALSDRKGWALFIGTPKGVNLFSELFYRARQLPDWHSAAFTVYDTDALDPGEVERLKRDMTETSFAREYLCDFSAAGDDQLLSLREVEEAVGRHLRRDQYDFAGKVLGVDPARFGDDRSVVFPRQGLHAGKPDIYRGIDNMTLADRIAARIDAWQPDAVFIDAGNGSGVIDRLRQLHYDVVEVHFSGAPSASRFLNKRAEMWFDMRDWILGGGAIPDIVELKQDLAAPTYHFTAADKIQLEAKDAIKARGLPSPDLGDALALTFAYPVYRDHSAAGLARRMGMTIVEETALDYDPYARV
jgi:hypothetical protein